MKRNVDYPEYEEHRNFRLTNEQRPYFGLETIEKHWEEVVIKEGTTVFYNGNKIKKMITWENFRWFEYKEIDTELETQDRQYIIPKTSNGKLKKITPTNLLSCTPTGCMMYISLSPLIKAWCPRNNIELPITEYDEIRTISDIRIWLENYIKTCPHDYFDKVHRMKTLSHRTIKYRIGDIFRFEIDREHYGYGLIIGKLREMIKMGVFPKGHPMNDLMTVPIMIRLYAVKTIDKDLSIEEVLKYELLPPDIMCDNEIIWGTHEIVGRKTVNQNDIDFPIQIGCDYNNFIISGLHFAWGIGNKIIQQTDLNLPMGLISGAFNNIGVSISLHRNSLDRYFKGQSLYNKSRDILHPDNSEKKEYIYKLFKLPLDIDFDTFNKQNNGMTKAEYVQLINDM